MENTLNLLNIRSFLLVLIGSLIITLGALIKIPFYPVPFTLQTLAIFILGLTQHRTLALGSTLTYLLWGTLGLPVFPSGVNPLWIAGPCAGYLLAFPLAAFLIAYLRELIHPFFAVILGQAVIYLLGFLWLIPFIGMEEAWMKGIVFFIPSGLLKVLVAVKISDHWSKK